MLPRPPAFLLFTTVSSSTTFFQVIAPPLVPIATSPIPVVLRIPRGSLLSPEPAIAAFSRRLACALRIRFIIFCSTSTLVCARSSFVTAIVTELRCGVIVCLVKLVFLVSPAAPSATQEAITAWSETRGTLPTKPMSTVAPSLASTSLSWRASK